MSRPHVSAEEQFRILRVTIETRLAAPFKIVVTSATADDGSAELAMGLASTFAASGRRTAIVVPAQISGSLTRAVSLGERIDLLRGPDDIDEALQGARQRYDVSIIDGGPISLNSETLRMAAESDGVLIAVRLGRTLEAADAEVLPLLTRVQARVLGVVTTDPAWLRGADTARGTNRKNAPVSQDLKRAVPAKIG